MRAAVRFTATLALTLLLVPAAALQAQERVTISGRVVDQAKQPVAGASVGLKDGSTVFTNAEGRFLLYRVPTGDQVLQVRQLGYNELDAAMAIPADPQPLELVLNSDPILLEKIEVMVDRLERRRAAVPVSMHAYGEDLLDTTPAITLVDFLRQSTTAQLRNCGGGNQCVYKRGQTVRPEVYIDERPAYGGLLELEAYPPQMIHSVEVIATGTHIRVYTKRFAQRLADREVMLMPVIATSIVR